jgi:site-specific DNA-cytosine methylase
MKVLSLFDGMSGAQLALKKAGIPVEKYFASEIDKDAMQVTQDKFPNTIQLGTVEFITRATFGSHRIDLLVGGSPCQGFSFAGKQLNFEDPRSVLFFEFVRLLRELRPRYFLLENVKMKKEYQDVITGLLGVEPILIDSALVSAQTRKRLYWTNIPGVAKPDDKGIVLRDVIEYGTPIDESGNVVLGNSNPSGNGMDGIIRSTGAEKANCLTTNKGEGPKYGWLEQVGNKLRHPEATKKGYAEAGDGEGLDLTFPKSKTRRGRSMPTKSNCLTAAGHEMGVVVKGGAIRGRYNEQGKTEQRLEVRDDDKTNAITTVSKDSVVVADIVGKYVTELRRENIDEASCLMAKDYKGFGNQAQTGIRDGYLKWRKLTPLECERLQTCPDGHTLVLDPVTGKQLVSNSQRYKMLGNGFTVDVIAHILKGICPSK